jgi:hypothetical protein
MDDPRRQQQRMPKWFENMDNREARRLDVARRAARLDARLGDGRLGDRGQQPLRGDGRLGDPGQQPLRGDGRLGDRGQRMRDDGRQGDRDRDRGQRDDGRLGDRGQRDDGQLGDRDRGQRMRDDVQPGDAAAVKPGAVDAGELGLSEDVSKFMARFREGFGSLTEVDKPSSPAIDLLTNDQLFRLSPERFNFYMNRKDAIDSGDEEIMQRVLGIETLSRFAREKMARQTSEIAEGLLSVQAARNMSGGGGSERQQHGGAYWKTLYDQLAAAETIQDDDQKAEAIRGLAQAHMNNPIYSEKTLQVTLTDRIIFIAITFALRSFALTLVQWGLSTRMVNTMEMAVVMYVVAYLLMFALWVLIVNIGSRDMFLHMVFYYVNTQGDKGAMRVWLHAILLFVLVPVPFALRAKSDDANPKLSTEGQARTMTMLTNISFIMWAVSAFVALRF